MDPKKIKAIVFDFDGTICDSLDIKGQAFADLYKSYGHHVQDIVRKYHAQNGGIPRDKKFLYFQKEIIKEDSSEKKIENLKKRDTLGKLGFDSVIISDFDESLKSVITSLIYTDVSTKKVYFITLNQWFDNSLLKEESSQNIYFPSVNKKNWLGLLNKTYSSNPLKSVNST